MLLNKKAVSPLIATVLLVMIVVSIGAAVMVVIQGLTQEQLDVIEQQKDLIACGSEVDNSLIQVGDHYRACMNVTSAGNGVLALYIENTGLKDISGFRVKVIGATGFNSTTYDSTSLNKGEMKGFKFNFGGVGNSNAAINKISINPRIAGKDIITCVDPRLEFEVDFLKNLDDCNDPNVNWDDTIPVAQP
jgi:flagellin-like protein